MWAPLVLIPLPPKRIGRRRRLLLKKDWFKSLFSRFTVETVHNCDSNFRNLIGVSSVHFCLIRSVRYANFLTSSHTPQKMGNEICLLVQIHPLWWTFELRITKNSIPLETIVNYLQNLFDTSLPHVVDCEMLFLCFYFAVPNITRSSHWWRTLLRIERTSSRHLWRCRLDSLSLKRCPQMH